MRGERRTDRTFLPWTLEKASSREKGTGWKVFVYLLPPLAGVFLLTLAYASGASGEGGHDEPGLMGFVWKLVNFVILGGIIYALMAKKVKGFFAGRREGIGNALADAETARNAAEKKFHECSEKLDEATEEIDRLTDMIRSQGLAEKERLIEEARKVAQKMREDTQTRMDQEFSVARQQLRSEAVRLSTKLAEALLREKIRMEDHEAMVKDYIEKVVDKN